MNPFEGEVCKNGHIRTPENTRYHYDSQRNRYRKRCLDCSRVTSPKVSSQVIRARDRVETLVELMDMGADAAEIPMRAGYPNRKAVLRSLSGLGLVVIQERFRKYV